MSDATNARAKQLDALDALGRIEVDVFENKMSETVSDCYFCGKSFNHNDARLDHECTCYPPDYDRDRYL
jgi:hypothetical protein